MPMLQVNLLSGYSSRVKDRLTRSLTAVVRGITQAKPEAISVWIQDVPPEDYSRGGVSRQPGMAAADPAIMVSAYLEAMERRDLDRARSYLADDFSMVFPGSGELHSLADLVSWAKGRYRYVNKTVAAINVAYEMEQTLVFVTGTLSGQWPDGSAFDNIRFIDRFEIEGDRLTRQEVWNDLAIAAPVTVSSNDTP